MRHDSGNKRHEQGTARLERGREHVAPILDRALKRVLDVGFAAFLLVIASPLIAALALAIKLESPGPVFYRCRRVGLHGRALSMLKFRKMTDGAEGPALSAPDDARFTRLGSFFARTKLDELPQLWNVLKGEMSLVGPRPEDPAFVEMNRRAYSTILEVRPGITGLSQVAFASESAVLDPEDRVGHYVGRILPQKIRIDRLYADRQSFSMDLSILWWTMRAVLGGRDVAVHRETGRLSLRAPRSVAVGIPEGSRALVLQQKAS